MMPRVFVTTQPILGTELQISGDDGHHFARVLRVRPGEPLAVAWQGRGYLGEVTSVDASAGVVCLLVTEALPSHESARSVYLIQGLAKGDKIDDIIQHNTELGVAGFLLYEARRSVSKVDLRKRDTKLARWQKIAQEAASQSQRDVIPEVSHAQNTKDVEAWLRCLRDPVLLLLDESETTIGLYLALSSAEALAEDASIVLAVGPEGGWDESEREDWVSRLHARTISLGPRTLRTESAGLAAASAVFHHFRQLGG